MSFLIQRPAGRGLSLTQINAAVLRIGRGTNQELRSENPAVALEHAIIESDAAGYLITDKGSITGTYVNRKPVETSRLSKGDVVEIGDLRLEVQLADPAKPLFLRVTTTRAATAAFDEDAEDVVVSPAVAPGARVVKPKKIDFADAYRLRRPYLTKLTFTALLLIVALAVVGELIRPEKQPHFMPGGVSSAHARAPHVSDRCDACHTPWKSVSNDKCVDCHPHQPHARFEADAPDCFSCHAEHRGATKLADIPNALCVDCHADLNKHVRAPRAQLASARFGNGRYGFDDIARVAAFGPQHPELVYDADRNPLKFNHRLHLAPKGVFNDTGRREVLECKSCHAMANVKGNLDPVAIDYEPHCQRCHRLTFDARIPNTEVPHGGDPRITYGYVALMYSGNRDLIGRPPAEVRRILTTRRGVAVDTRAQISADHVIKTKCQKCHDVARRGEQLAVTPPVIPAQWLSSAIFTHTRHLQIGCEHCHEGARTSAATSEVLLPRRQKCDDCHAPNAKIAQAASACRSCHLYHLQPKRQVIAASLAPAAMLGLGGGGRMLQGILLAVIVILLLVVLVPVGIALFQRLRPERSQSGPPRPAQPRVPPPVDVPTAKIAPMTMPPPAPKPAAAPVPPPPAAPLPPVDRTKLDAPEAAAAPEQAGTEMVQWYGMLHCTSGPLEGQRFVVEEDGFYIGRDPALSKIAVPDNRISKRHVRILPRDGRVWAIDEGSTNGTFVGGQRITEVQLKRGDALILGDNAATFVYQI